MSTRRRAVVPLGLLATVAVVGISCGVPTGEDSFDQIADDDVPFRLAEESTTTTSSTTTVPTTTLPDAPATTAESTTTSLPTESVSIYLLSRDGLQPIPAELPQGFGIGQLVAALEAGAPEGAAGVGLDTLVDPGLIVDSSVEGGVVTVELDEVEFDQLQPRDQRPAVAQIVLTFTANLRGVGQVSFTLAGVPIGVPRGNGLLSEPGEPLAFDDYANMLAEVTVGPGGEPPDSTTTTTEPKPPPTDAPTDTKRQRSDS